MNHVAPTPSVLLHPGSDALVLHQADNVATALHALQAGQSVRVHGAGDGSQCRVHDAIDTCHKFALRDIRSGEVVVKYGESIGQASQDIRQGHHVHIHNLRSLRARGGAGEAPA